MTERVRIGELLVETGLITRDQLNEALGVQKDDPRRLGEIVVAAGMVSEAKVTQVLSQQLSVPWVSLEYVDFSRQLLNLVSSKTAQEHTLVPIYVRRSKQRRETLYVAIEDPSNQDALDEVADFSGLPVRPMIAPPSDIRSAIRAYYLNLPPEEPAEEPAPVVTAPEPKVSSRPPPPSRRPVPPPAEPAVEGSPEELEENEIEALNDDDSDPDSVELKARDSMMPQPSTKEDAPPMITLTMLDGTQMRLPAARGRRANVPPSGELTARDLVEALRAEGGGTDLSAVLGSEVNWQKMFAALLSLMLKKHLILDWEFVRELKR
jgi:type IV pilus assembly protein PilB